MRDEVRVNKLYRTLGFALLILTVLVMVFYVYGQFFKRQKINVMTDCKELDIDWYWNHDGRIETFRLPLNLDAEPGEKVVIWGTLPDDLEDKMFLFMCYGRDFKVEIDGDVRFQYNHENNWAPGRIAKSIWWSVPVNYSDRGKEIRIIKDEEGMLNGKNYAMYYGYSAALYSMLLKKCGLTFVLACIMVAISLVIMVTGIFMKPVIYNAMQFVYLGFSTLMTALWFIFDSDFYQYIFNNYYIEGVVGYMVTTLLPFPFILFINSVQNNRYKLIHSVSLFLCIVNTVVFAFLHFLDIAYYGKTIVALDLIVAVVAMTVFITVFIDIYSHQIERYRFVGIGLAGFVICGISEIVLVNTVEDRIDGVFLMGGMYFLLAMSVIHFFSEVNRIHKEREEAKHASDMKSNFLANMSHEIRTPINSIIGMNEMILREAGDPVIEGYAEYIAGSSKILLGLVNDVLDFSKIESGKIDIECEPYKTAGLLCDMAELLQESAGRKNIEAIVDVDTAIPAVLDGDEIHVRQIIVNILSNAVKYTPEGSVSLICSCTKPDSERNVTLEVTVKDTGIGIKPENIDKLFESFTRVDMTHNRDIEGTGLGLAIVKTLVDKMGGKITVESEYGVGTSIKVVIPQKLVSSAPIGPEWRLDNSHRTMGSHYRVSFMAPEGRILVVDDNQSNLLIIKQLLKRTKLRIDLSKSGKDALARCNETKFDLILLDHMMPEMDGLETFKILRGDSEGLNYETPVVILTANALVGSREEYLNLGFDDYLSKPVDAKLLEEMVGRYIPNEKKLSEKQILEAEERDLADDNAKEASETNVAVDKVADKVAEDKTADGLEKIDGLDYATLSAVFGGDKGFISEVMLKVAEESLDKLEVMKECSASEDYAGYAVAAHGIKGMMASICYKPLQMHAKEHEFAAKEGRSEYIKEDMDLFVAECSEFCNKIRDILKD